MLFEKIVAIDDDLRQLESLKAALSGHYEVVCFRSGAEALEFLKSPNGARLVLSDVCMPGMDGLSLLQEIRGLGREIGVILLTGFGSREVVVQALRSGADDFIDKPFDVVDLRGKVRSLLEKKFGSVDNKSVLSRQLRSFTELNLSHVVLKDLAGELCLSSKYVGRIFKEENDVNFRDYKIAAKIEKAKELLSNTTYPVFKIAGMLGYQNPETFMRIFKRKTACTPLQFRERGPGHISA